jgi:hypothetical protein
MYHRHHAQVWGARIRRRELIALLGGAAVQPCLDAPLQDEKGEHQMAKRTFTASLMAEVAALIEQGLDRAEIAERLGCNIGSLRVRCSQHGISLRRVTTLRRSPHSLPIN